MRDRPIFLHHLTPLQILLGSTVIAAAVVIASLIELTHQPWLGLQLKAQAGSQGLAITTVHPDSPAYGRLYPGYSLQGLRIGKQELPLGEQSLQDAPHFVYGSFAELDRYLQHQAQLARAFDQRKLGLLDQKGRLYWLETRNSRPVLSLPAAFWLYSAFGVIAFLLGVAIWAHKRGRMPARLTAVAGLVFLGFATSSAVLAGRELYLPVATLHTLLDIQRGSMYLFLALVMTALAVTPRGVEERGPVLGIFATLSLLWANEHWQVVQWPGHTYLFPLLSVLIGSLWIARRQWRFTSDWPEQHAAYKWLLLSLMIAIGLGAVVQLLPTIYYRMPANGLGVWTGVLFFLYLGLLMGMYGERRFNIERWWLEALAWFTGGAFVIGLDAALVFLLQLSPDKALGVAVLAIGWAYLPARHWFWKRIVRGEKQELEESLPLVLETLLAEDKRADLSAQWRELLQRLFEPMQLTIIERPLHRVTLQQSGLAMHVPSVHGDRTLELSWRKRGARLFSLADARLAESVLQLFRNRDAVTGLPNRNVLLDRIRQYQADTRSRQWALIFIRLKRFKGIMNLLGSEAGEEVLRQVPRRLRRAVKRTNVHMANAIAYMGNGEFAVFLPGYESEGVMPVLHAISDELRTPMQTGEHSVDLSAHMGVASSGPRRRGPDPDEQCRDRHARGQGRQCRIRHLQPGVRAEEPAQDGADQWPAPCHRQGADPPLPAQAGLAQQHHRLGGGPYALAPYPLWCGLAHRVHPPGGAEQPHPPHHLLGTGLRPGAGGGLALPWTQPGHGGEHLGAVPAGRRIRRSGALLHPPVRCASRCPDPGDHRE